MKAPLMRIQYCIWRLQNVAETLVLKTFLKAFWKHQQRYILQT